MRILLFCENRYAVDILKPIGDAALREGGHDVLWYVDGRKIGRFPLDGAVSWTGVMQEVYDWRPEAIFVPGNIVPYYLSGVKIQVFHGYASEKKGHWVIRRYFDTYFTQGPFFTRRFEELSRKYGDFEVLETGWSRRDWVHEHLRAFDGEREELLRRYGRKRIALYAPTFSKRFTSLPYMKEVLRRLVTERKDWLLLMKLHPLTARKWVEEYGELARETDGIVLMDDYSVARYMLMADVMLSDTSSTIYEFLLLDKPVITLRAGAKDVYWHDVQDVEDVPRVFDEVTRRDDLAERRRWVIENYDPYDDGMSSVRMLEGAKDYIRRHGVPQCRKLNVWRKYMCIKTFGRVR